MENNNPVYYDAHVKTHQRHILISWLESAKSEKIKKLQEEKLSILQRRIAVPRVSVPEDKLNYTAEFSDEVFDIYSVSEVVLHENDKLTFNPDIYIEDISSSLIHDDDIEMSEAVSDFGITIDKTFLSEVLPEKIAFPQKLGSVKFVFESDKFPDINQGDFELFGGISDYKTTIADEKFSGINVDSTEIPEGLNDFKANIETVKLDILQNLSFDIKSDISDYKNVVESHKFEGVLNNVKFPKENTDLTISIDKNNAEIGSINETVLPNGIADFDYTLNAEKFENIISEKIDAVQEKIDFMPVLDNVYFEGIDVDKVELPETVEGINDELKIDIDVKVIDTNNVKLSENIKTIDIKPNLDIDFKTIDLEKTVVLPDSIELASVSELDERVMDIASAEITVSPQEIDFKVDVGEIGDISLPEVKISENIVDLKNNLNINPLHIKNEPINISESKIALDIDIENEKLTAVSLPEISFPDFVGSLSAVISDSSTVEKVELTKNVILPDFSDIFKIMQTESNGVAV